MTSHTSPARDLALQEVIVRLARFSKGKQVSAVVADLATAMRAEGLGAMPAPWMWAVASMAAEGRVYVIGTTTEAAAGPATGSGSR